ncbi:MAG TPA: ribonuclease HII [Bacteroidetes bacterium]|nr:ribonuclease HII [Bacteroidota bacterium]
MGPLVVAGVKIKDEQRLIEISVKDSKKLSPKRRELLSVRIKQLVDNYELLVIPAKDIDDMRKVMTLNEIEVNAFRKVIKKLRPEICYVDSADVNEKRFARDILSGLSFNVEIISKHKADDVYPIVSAASILAKTKRDGEVSKIALKLQEKLDMPFGSGYPADVITQNFLKTWYKKFGKLPPHTRRSWKTVQNIINEEKNRKLSEF